MDQSLRAYIAVRMGHPRRKLTTYGMRIQMPDGTLAQHWYRCEQWYDSRTMEMLALLRLLEAVASEQPENKITSLGAYTPSNQVFLQLDNVDRRERMRSSGRKTKPLAHCESEWKRCALLRQMLQLAGREAREVKEKEHIKSAKRLAEKVYQFPATERWDEERHEEDDGYPVRICFAQPD